MESSSGYLPLLGSARGDTAAFPFSPVEQHRLQQRSCTFLDVLLAPFICAVPARLCSPFSIAAPVPGRLS
jgi:hypothetical protein